MRQKRSAGSVSVAVCCWLSLLAAACSPARADVEERLELASADAEVWAYQLTVTGQLVGGTELKACQVQVGDRLSSAELSSARAFRASVRLDPGDNRVQAICRTRQGARVASTPRQYRVRLPATPVAVARIGTDPSAAAHSGKLILDGSESTANPSTGRPILRYEWFAGDIPDDARVRSPRATKLGDGMRVTLPRPARKQLYSLRVSDDRGEHDVARVIYRPEAEPDAAARSAVMYGVLPPLYGTPPLRGVIAALPKLAELGVDVLWLAPLFHAPPGDFGYAVTDYFHVRSDYGSEADLRELVARAHALGLRVLLDLPANHSSREHPYFVEAAALGPRSHYYDFYDRDAAGEPTHYFDWEHLPNLNFASGEVARFMQEAAAHWLRAFDVDGYRLDAAWGIRERNPEWWPQLQAALLRTHPEHWLIAEASARDAYYRAPLFVAAYDWTADLGQHAWKDVFQSPTQIAQRMAAALRASADAAPRILRFLNNNDTGPRFITRHGRDLTRVATAALLSLPGLPCLYSFDEVGGEFEPYSTLEPIRARDAALRAHHRAWIRLRHEQRALSGAELELVYVGEQDEILAYLRSDGAERALVVLNFSGQPLQLSLDLGGQRWPTRSARELTRANKPRTPLQGQTLRVRLSGWDTRVYVPK